MSDTTPAKPDLKARITHEFTTYLQVSLYLFICFSITMLYAASLSPDPHPLLLAHGIALGKALVIGKFLLIGEALRVGSRVRTSRLWQQVAFRSLAMMAVLMGFTFLEELIVGWVHGEETMVILADLAAKPLLHFLAPALLMLLILIPMILTMEIDRALGQGTLRRLLTERGQASV